MRKRLKAQILKEIEPHTLKGQIGKMLKLNQRRSELLIIRTRKQPEKRTQVKKFFFEIETLEVKNK